MNATPWKTLLLTTLAVAGCGLSDSMEAEDAVETSNNTSTESALMDATAVESDSSMCALDASALAQRAATRVPQVMQPQGCAKATLNGDSVQFVFDNCSGPRGRVHVTGTVNVSYAMNSDCSITLHGTGKDITANKITLSNLDATAVYSKDPSSGLQKAVVNTRTQGSTPRGITFDHNGSYTVTRDGDACLTLEGEWSTDWNSSRGSAMTSTSATGLKKCANACPEAGGNIVHHGLLGRVLTVTLDGSSVAKWSTSGGKSGTVDLKCE